MEFKNGYNFMYQKAKEIYASKIGRPAEDDEAVDFGLTEEEKKNIKLVYENKEGLVISFDSLPSADDTQIQATINGEPVIGPSGGEPTPDKMIRFELGQKVKGYYFGNVKNGDTNLELEEYLFSLGDTAILVMGEDAESFGALVAGSEEIEEGHRIGVVYTATEDSGGIFVLYATEDFDFGHDFQGKKGYNNLTDGKFMCPEFIVQEMNEGTDDSWNGKFIGAITDGPTPTPTLTPFELGQTIKGFDFGNVSNGDVSAELSNFLLTKVQEGGSESTTGYFVIGDGDTALIGINANSMQEGLAFVFIAANNPIILYSTQDFNIEGVSGTKGFQNLTDGKYILGDSSTIDTISANIEDTSWNGRLIGAVLGEPGPGPEPTTKAFAIGDIIHNGNILHIDKSKEADLLAWFNEYVGEEQIGLVESENFYLGAWKDAGGYFLGGEQTGAEEVFYIYSTVEAYKDGRQVYIGFNDVDDNGDMTISVATDSEILSIAETPNWNGTIIGIKE